MVAGAAGRGNQLALTPRVRVTSWHTPTYPLAPGDRPPPRPPKPPAPRATGAAAAPKPAPRGDGGPAARQSGTVPAPGDKVAAAYQDLLQEIVDKKKKAAEIRKLPPKRKKGPVVKAILAVLLPPIAAAVWIFNPFGGPPPSSPRPPDDLGAWRTALIDAALAIREWRDSAGGFPVDLAAAGIDLAGVTYEVTGPEQFDLKTFTTEGVVLVWMDGPRIGVGPKPSPADSAAAPPPVLP